MGSAVAPDAGLRAGLRIDRLLWFLRFAGSRALAQAWVDAGHIRLNGRRIERSSVVVRPGDVLVLPLRTTVRVVEVLTLPARRGPASEAAACYRLLDGSAGAGQAAGHTAQCPPE